MLDRMGLSECYKGASQTRFCNHVRRKPLVTMLEGTPMDRFEHIGQATTAENGEVEFTDLGPPGDARNSLSSWAASTLLDWQRSPRRRHHRRHWRLASALGILLLLVTLFSLNNGLSLLIMKSLHTPALHPQSKKV